MLRNDAHTYIEVDDETGAMTVMITSELVTLDSVTPEYIADYSKIFSNPETVAMYGDGQPWNEEKTIARHATWTKRWREQDPFSSFVVSLNDVDEVIGCVTLGHGDLAGQSELAYVLDHHHWGKGYGKDAVRAVVLSYTPEIIKRGYQIADEDGTLHPLTGICATSRIDNSASIAILKGLGMEIANNGAIEMKYGHKRFQFFLPVEKLLGGEEKADESRLRRFPPDSDEVNATPSLSI